MKIYTLETDNGNEVKDFLNDDGNVEKRKAIAGFVFILRQIANSGYKGIPPACLKGWRENGEMFFEIKKGRYRIGCFKYDGDKLLLLVSEFEKHQYNEKKEYERAIRLRRRFDLSPEWERL